MARSKVADLGDQFEWREAGLWATELADWVEGAMEHFRGEAIHGIKALQMVTRSTIGACTKSAPADADAQ
jgi:hypothetical protein